MFFINALGSFNFHKILTVIQRSEHIRFLYGVTVIIKRLLHMARPMIKHIMLFGEHLSPHLSFLLQILNLFSINSFSFHSFFIFIISQFFSVSFIFSHFLLFFVMFQYDFVHSVQFSLFKVLSFICQGLLNFYMIFILLVIVSLIFVKSPFFGKSLFTIIFTL